MRQVSQGQIARQIAVANWDKDICTVHAHTRIRTHWHIPLKMNQRAYISAPLRFLASTIISCNSTDTSSERIKEREREREGERRLVWGSKKENNAFTTHSPDRQEEIPHREYRWINCTSCCRQLSEMKGSLLVLCPVSVILHLPSPWFIND